MDDCDETIVQLCRNESAPDLVGMQAAVLDHRLQEINSQIRLEENQRQSVDFNSTGTHNMLHLTQNSNSLSNSHQYNTIANNNIPSLDPHNFQTVGFGLGSHFN